MARPAQAGLRPGDMIVRTLDQTHTDARSVLRAAAKSDIGDTLDLVVWRHGGEQTMPVRVALWPRLPQDVAHVDDTTQPEPPGLGVRFANITPALRKQFGIPPRQSGVVVQSVDERSDARDRGLGPGDLILQVQSRQVNTVADVDAALRQRAGATAAIS